MPPTGSGPAAAALVDVRHTPYWLDGPAPDPCPALAGPAETDLAVVGGGYTGLWTALQAKERDPGRDVVLLEARTVGWAASGRNGGFCAASLTHGLRNGPPRPGPAILDRDGVAMLDPARLARGLRAACLRLGVRIWENTPVAELEGTGTGMVLRTPYGRVTARHVALGTNAFPPLLRRLSSYVVPVWDYALMTEPLTAAQRAAVGWADRHRMAAAGNLFHYCRVTDDWRILWGGYDAVYRFGGRTDDAMERNPETFLRLAEHFFATFPQLDGLRFTHAWGGIIDTCSRFSPFWGTAHGGRVAYAAGYTGLGVGTLAALAFPRVPRRMQVEV